MNIEKRLSKRENIMKKQIIAGFIILSMRLTVVNADTVREENGSKILVVELDKEGEDNNKGGASDILKAIIHIGNNDEVQFVGENTLMARPITIEIKDQFDKVKKILVDVFTVKSSELAVGDTVVISNRRDKVIAEKKVEE